MTSAGAVMTNMFDFIITKNKMCLKLEHLEDKSEMGDKRNESTTENQGLGKEGVR